MKTIHTLAAVISFAISSISHAENTMPQTETGLTISVLELNQPTCNGASNGSVLVKAEGGKLPYTYNWNTFPEQSTAMAINLSQGIYFIQVTDADGLVSYRSVEIQDPIQTIVNPAAISSIASQSVTVISSTDNNTFVFYLNGERVLEPIISGLDIGIHKLEITNQNNCTLVQFIQIVEVQSDSTAINSTAIGVSQLVNSNELFDTNTSILVQNE